MVVRVPNKAALRTPPKRPGRAELLAAVKGEAVNIRSPQGASGAASGPLYVPGLRVGGSQTKDKGFAGPVGDIINILDKPRALVVSSLKEAVDLAQGEGASFTDWWNQVGDNYMMDQFLRDEGIDLGRWGNFGVGLALDLALDPLLYVPVLCAARMHANWKNVSKGLDSASKAAYKAGNIAKGDKLRTAADKVTKTRSASYAGAEALEELGIKAGLSMLAPGTSRLGRNILEKPINLLSGNRLTPKLAPLRAKQVPKYLVDDDVWKIADNIDEVVEAMSALKSKTIKTGQFSKQAEKAARLANSMGVELPGTIRSLAGPLGLLASGPGRLFGTVMRTSPFSKAVINLGGEKSGFKALSRSKDPQVRMDALRWLDAHDTTKVERGVLQTEWQNINKEVNDQLELTQSARKMMGQPELTPEDLAYMSDSPNSAFTVPKVGFTVNALHSKMKEGWVRKLALYNKGVGHTGQMRGLGAPADVPLGPGWGDAAVDDWDVVDKGFNEFYTARFLDMTKKEAQKAAGIEIIDDGKTWGWRGASGDDPAKQRKWVIGEEFPPGTGLILEDPERAGKSVRLQMLDNGRTAYGDDWQDIFLTDYNEIVTRYDKSMLDKFFHQRLFNNAEDAGLVQLGTRTDGDNLIINRRTQGQLSELLHAWKKAKVKQDKLYKETKATAETVRMAAQAAQENFEAGKAKLDTDITEAQNVLSEIEGGLIRLDEIAADLPQVKELNTTDRRNLLKFLRSYKDRMPYTEPLNHEQLAILAEIIEPHAERLRLLRQIKDELIDSIQNDLAPELRASREAVARFGREEGIEGAGPALIPEVEFLERITQRLNNAEQELRRLAAEGIDAAKDDKSVQQLNELLKHSGDAAKQGLEVPAAGIVADKWIDPFTNAPLKARVVEWDTASQGFGPEVEVVAYNPGGGGAVGGGGVVARAESDLGMGDALIRTGSPVPAGVEPNALYSVKAVKRAKQEITNYRLQQELNKTTDPSRRDLIHRGLKLTDQELVKLPYEILENHPALKYIDEWTGILPKGMGKKVKNPKIDRELAKLLNTSNNHARQLVNWFLDNVNDLHNEDMWLFGVGLRNPEVLKEFQKRFLPPLKKTAWYRAEKQAVLEGLDLYKEPVQYGHFRDPVYVAPASELTEGFARNTDLDAATKDWERLRRKAATVADSREKELTNQLTQIFGARKWFVKDPWYGRQNPFIALVDNEEMYRKSPGAHRPRGGATGNVTGIEDYERAVTSHEILPWDQSPREIALQKARKIGEEQERVRASDQSSRTLPELLDTESLEKSNRPLYGVSGSDLEQIVAGLEYEGNLNLFGPLKAALDTFRQSPEQALKLLEDAIIGDSKRRVAGLSGAALETADTLASYLRLIGEHIRRVPGTKATQHGGFEKISTDPYHARRAVKRYLEELQEGTFNFGIKPNADRSDVLYGSRRGIAASLFSADEIAELKQITRLDFIDLTDLDKARLVRAYDDIEKALGIRANQKLRSLTFETESVRITEDPQLLQNVQLLTEQFNVDVRAFNRAERKKATDRWALGRREIREIRRREFTTEEEQLRKQVLRESLGERTHVFAGTDPQTGREIQEIHEQWGEYYLLPQELRRLVGDTFFDPEASATKFGRHTDASTGTAGGPLRVSEEELRDFERQISQQLRRVESAQKDFLRFSHESPAKLAARKELEQLENTLRTLQNEYDVLRTGEIIPFASGDEAKVINRYEDYMDRPGTGVDIDNLADKLQSRGLIERATPALAIEWMVNTALELQVWKNLGAAAGKTGRMGRTVESGILEEIPGSVWSELADSMGMSRLKDDPLLGPMGARELAALYRAEDVGQVGYVIRDILMAAEHGDDKLVDLLSSVVASRYLGDYHPEIFQHHLLLEGGADIRWGIAADEATKAQEYAPSVGGRPADRQGGELNRAFDLEGGPSVYRDMTYENPNKPDLSPQETVAAAGPPPWEMDFDEWFDEVEELGEYLRSEYSGQNLDYWLEPVRNKRIISHNMPYDDDLWRWFNLTQPKLASWLAETSGTGFTTNWFDPNAVRPMFDLSAEDPSEARDLWTAIKNVQRELDEGLTTARDVPKMRAERQQSRAYWRDSGFRFNDETASRVPPENFGTEKKFGSVSTSAVEAGQGFPFSVNLSSQRHRLGKGRAAMGSDVHPAIEALFPEQPIRPSDPQRVISDQYPSLDPKVAGSSRLQNLQKSATGPAQDLYKDKKTMSFLEANETASRLEGITHAALITAGIDLGAANVRALQEAIEMGVENAPALQALDKEIAEAERILSVIDNVDDRIGGIADYVDVERMRGARAKGKKQRATFEKKRRSAYEPGGKSSRRERIPREFAVGIAGSAEQIAAVDVPLFRRQVAALKQKRAQYNQQIADANAEIDSLTLQMEDAQSKVYPAEENMRNAQAEIAYWGALRQSAVDNMLLEADELRKSPNVFDQVSAAETQQDAIRSVMQSRNALNAFNDAYGSAVGNWAGSFKQIGNRITPGKATKVGGSGSGGAGNYVMGGGEGFGEAEFQAFSTAIQSSVGLNNPIEISKALATYLKFANWWKSQAVMSPGFIMRNLLGGAMINSLVAGVEMGTHSRIGGMALAARKAGDGDILEGARLLATQGKPTTLKNMFGVNRKVSPRDWDVFAELMESGAVSPGQIWSEIESSIKSGIGTFDRSSRMGFAEGFVEGSWNPAKVDFKLSAAVRTQNERAEFVLRAALGFDVMSKGGSAEDALRAINKYHFDYADLTRAERRLKMFIPFYTWQKNIIPVLIESIGKAPQAWTGQLRAKRHIESLSSEEGVKPDYYDDLMGIRLPWKWKIGGSSWLGGRIYATPDTPFRNLFQMTKEKNSFVREPLQSMYPWVKTPIELFADKQSFADIPFSGRYQQLPHVYAKIPGLMQALEPIGMAKKNSKGEWKMRDQNIYMLDQISPIFGRARRLFANEEAKQRRMVTTWVSFLFGGGFRINDRGERTNQIIKDQVGHSKDMRDLGDIENRRV